MKRNTMANFKEISNLVANQSIELDFFDNNSIETKRSGNKNQPSLKKHGKQIGQGKNNKSEILGERIFLEGSRKEVRQIGSNLMHFELLEMNLVDYIEIISWEQKVMLRKELQNLLEEVSSSPDYDTLKQQMEALESEIAKSFQNRLLHLMFYLMLYHLQAVDSSRQVEKEIYSLTLCEYYSRKFLFRRVALCICMMMQQIYVRITKYEESRHYARKCLKLAVILKDSYSELKMIETLGLLNYYEGRLNNPPLEALGKEERARVIRTYNEQDELPNLNHKSLNQKPISFQFLVEAQNNFIQDHVPEKNLKYFYENYHLITKGIREKRMALRTTITKVNQVGTVNKYIGKDNYIRLQPEGHSIKPLFQEQVLLTHKKVRHEDSRRYMMKTILPKFQQLLGTVIASIDFY